MIMVHGMGAGQCHPEVSGSCMSDLASNGPRVKLSWVIMKLFAVQAACKEYFWKSMDDAAKKAFHDAAMEAWQIWPDNNAVEILSLEESEKIRSRLARDNENHKLLAPHYVFTDKNEPLRTKNHPLPL